ncbi:LPS-assembly protein LptD [Halodurantibacterium flavum]|uniref:LPS-assembly protein LptD n=1 Tax=Halodurantibacterium flavum TaxID=1382802 RepID=A0ABW4S449_9RHOB
MKTLRALALGALLALPIPAPLLAQGVPATLIADRISVAGDNMLIAEGAVEVLYEGRRMRASRIAYDQSTGQLAITGPITLVDPESGVILVASEAELSDDLRDGILLGARMVLDRQLQLAARSIARREGRYTELDRTVASSCQVCAANPTPLWEIRAARVVHDELERQLYFDRAQFRVMGIPVAYIPRLRLPDPTVERTSGFLAPRFRTTNTLGWGAKVPYFLTLGDHADLTLTPYLSSGRTRTLDWRYRQAVRGGQFSFEGAFSDDNLSPDRLRGYIFGSGRFDMPAGYVLSFGIETVSDSYYLQDYDISDQDRLTSFVALNRTRRDEHFGARVLHFRSIRAGEINAEQPTVVTELDWQRRLDLWGGIATGRFNAHTHYRPSAADITGRDVARASASAEWQRSWVLPNGMVATTAAQSTFDFYALRQDSTMESPQGRATPAVGVELRWPWMRNDPNGVTHVIEPVVQIVGSRVTSRNLPDEDSVLVELDEGNLFALDRFPGWDRNEDGVRANVGLSYTRIDPSGWQLGLAVGRVIRMNQRSQFPDGSGLNATLSDWLVVADLTNFSLGGRGTVSITNRALFDEGLSFSRNELRLLWDAGRLDLATSYLHLQPDADQGRDRAVQEWALDAAWRVTANWEAQANWRYDFEADQAQRAGAGLRWRNECVTVDLSLSRRFTSSTSVRPTTTFGLSVDLIGFGTGQAGARSRACAL